MQKQSPGDFPLALDPQRWAKLGLFTSFRQGWPAGAAWVAEGDGSAAHGVADAEVDPVDCHPAVRMEVAAVAAPEGWRYWEAEP